MNLAKLTINNIRNIQQAQIEPLHHINVFFGNNGSGKTSVLEAIHLLGLGRSFSAARTKSIIKKDEVESVLYASIGEAGMGLGMSRRRDGKHQIKIAGEKVTSSAQLAGILPIQIINSDSFLLLSGSPTDRRRFLDAGVFHVEQAFYSVWQRLQKSVKNRNSLLRSGTLIDPLRESWEAEFIKAAEQIDQYRQRYLAGFKPEFERVLSRLIDLPDLSLHYARGWDKNRSIAEVLAQNLQRDLKLGYTSAGPQRGDLKFKIYAGAASDVLSRGQQKLVVCALKIAQGYYLAKKTNKQFVYLVDDLPSELDAAHIQLMCEMLEELKAQVFITCIDQQQLQHVWRQQSPNMFHVEQGVIRSA